MQFHSFDEAYLARLRAADPATQQDFVTYFSALIQIKLRSRLRSREAIEDIRQETFVRFFVALQQGRILQPERLGSYVNSMCTNVLMEQYRGVARETPLDDDDDKEKELPAKEASVLDILESSQMERQVREILETLSERDRRLLREVFLEERDKEEVCKSFDVDRDYLRVLLLRAKRAFKKAYLESMNRPPTFGASLAF